MVVKRSAAIRLMEKIIRNEFPKILAQKKRAAKQREKVMRNFEPFNVEMLKKHQDLVDKMQNPPSHPWRLCALGSHWVKTHERQIAKGVTVVDGHCRKNSGKREILTFDEIQEIQRRNFHQLTERPSSYEKVYKKKSSKYDLLIVGWTKYWNEIFKPSDPLDYDFVKALMTSESDYNPNITIPVGKGKKNWARGLMQVTDETVKILNDPKGELKDHLFSFSKDQVLDPNVNIATAIRWLFHKKYLAGKRLKREATWEEALIEYKGYMGEYLKNPKLKMKGLGVFEKHFLYLKNSNL